MGVHVVPSCCLFRGVNADREFGGIKSTFDVLRRRHSVSTARTPLCVRTHRAQGPIPPPPCQHACISLPCPGCPDGYELLCSAFSRSSVPMATAGTLSQGGFEPRWDGREDTLHPPQLLDPRGVLGAWLPLCCLCPNRRPNPYEKAPASALRPCGPAA